MAYTLGEAAKAVGKSKATLSKAVKSGRISAFKNEGVNDEPGTLMSRMAQDQYINLNSGKYNLVIVEFEDNMRDIFHMIQDLMLKIRVFSIGFNSI